MDPRKISGMLANENRLKVFAAVVLGARTLDVLSNRTKLEDNTIKRSLGQLIESGLISEIEDVGYSLCIEELRNTSASTDKRTAVDSYSSVVGRYIKNGHLISWPRQRKDRLLVLDHIAKMFDLNNNYQESEVNEKLLSLHEDFALARRYLIDEGFLNRANQQTAEGPSHIVYWRTIGK